MKYIIASMIFFCSTFIFHSTSFAQNNSILKTASTTKSMPLTTSEISSLCSVNYSSIVYQYQKMIASATTQALKDTYTNSYNTFLANWKTYCSTTTPTYTTTYTYIDNSYFVEANTGILATYPQTIRTEVANLVYRYKVTFQYMVQDMIKNGILTYTDKYNMKKKIVLYYIEDCENLNGRTTVQQWYDPNTNQYSKTTLVGMLFRINVCSNSSLYTTLKSYTAEIITHELGHIYNFMHDINSEGFSSICRNRDTRKASCTRASFVSDYAMSNADEDYAETFTARYRKLFPITSNSALLAKQHYFNAIQQR